MLVARLRQVCKKVPKNRLEEKLISFFRAENNRNWKVYEPYLSADVEWVL
jgi:hypothetical protein